MKRKKEQVLVVTPTLGKSRWLEQTRASVVAHCPGAIHVLATPGSEVCGLQHRFPSCTVVADRGKAGGMYGAINAGIVAAADSWDWFTYINDDDLLAPGFSSILGQIVSGQADLYYGDVAYVDEADRVIAPIPIERNPLYFRDLFRCGITPLVQQGMLVRRDLLERLGCFDTAYSLSSDLDFLARAFAGGAIFRHAGTMVGAFRIQPGQLSGQAAAMEAQCRQIRERLFPGTVSAWHRLRTHATFVLRNHRCYRARLGASGLRSSRQIIACGKKSPA